MCSGLLMLSMLFSVSTTLKPYIFYFAIRKNYVNPFIYKILKKILHFVIITQKPCIFFI